MKKKLFSILSVILCIVSAKADDEVRKWEGEVFAGPNVTIGEASEMNHYFPLSKASPCWDIRLAENSDIISIIFRSTSAFVSLFQKQATMCSGKGAIIGQIIGLSHTVNLFRYLLSATGVSTGVEQYRHLPAPVLELPLTKHISQRPTPSRL